MISPDSEAVFYGVLDLMAKPVFGALLLWGHKGIDPRRLGLHFRDYTSDPIAMHGDNNAEKKTNSAPVPTSNGHNGTTSTNV